MNNAKGAIDPALLVKAGYTQDRIARIIAEDINKRLWDDLYKAIVKELKKALKHLPIVSEYVSRRQSIRPGTVISLRTGAKQLHHTWEPHQHLCSDWKDEDHDLVYAAINVSKQDPLVCLLKTRVSMVHCAMVDGFGPRPKHVSGLSSRDVISVHYLDDHSWPGTKEIESVKRLDIADPNFLDAAVNFMESQAALLETELSNKDRICYCDNPKCLYNKPAKS